MIYRNRSLCSGKKRSSLDRIICIILLAIILATSLCGCTLFRPLRLPQLREFEKDVRKMYPRTSVSCRYNYEASVHITVTGSVFDDESAFTILGRLRAVVSDEAFIQDLFELFEKESHGDPNWKNGSLRQGPTRRCIILDVRRIPTPGTAMPHGTELRLWTALFGRLPPMKSMKR